jgi:hypothetical protein
MGGFSARKSAHQQNLQKSLGYTQNLGMRELYEYVERVTDKTDKFTNFTIFVSFVGYLK